MDTYTNQLVAISIDLKTHVSSHLANIRMILQVRMNTLIDQQQLELFLKQYPGNDFLIYPDNVTT